MLNPSTRMGGIAVLLLAYNVWSLSPLRGLDTRWRQAFDQLGGQLEKVGHGRTSSSGRVQFSDEKL